VPDRDRDDEKLIALVRQFAPGLRGSGAAARTQLLSEAGLTALATVRLMLAIESKFALHIPEAEITPENFANLDAIELLIARMRGPPRASRRRSLNSIQRLEPAAPVQQAGRLAAEPDRLHGADDDRVGVAL
jgi:acyl carrier protein